MPPDQCPSEPELLAFHLGRLPADALHRLESHLADCRRCEKELERLDETQDDVVAALRLSTRNWRSTSGPPTAVGDPPAIPGYEMLGELGRGGMGVVFQARQLALDRVVALKMILGGWLAGPEDRARFRREAEAVARLRHPGIVQIYEVGEQAGLPYFSLEWVEGGTLEAHIGGQPQPPAAAAALVEQLARAVQYAHEHGVVHRDLKPANILLTADGIPKIADFGLAKRLDGTSGRTRTGDMAGTPQYMAPEQAAGEPGRIGPATDVHALGAILFALLTGRPPFRAATTAETLLQVIGADPPSVSRLRPGVPRDLAVVCQRCLEKDPARRYASAAALAEDLRRFQAGEPILARRVGDLERAWKWAKRRPAVAGLAVAVAMSLLVGVAVSLYFAVAAERRAREAVAERNHSRRQLADADLQRGLALADRGRVADGLHWMLAGLRGLPDAPADDPLRRVARINLAAWGARLPTLLFQESYPDDILAATFSADGQRFAVGGIDGMIRIYNTESGEPAGEPLRHGYQVIALAFGPDGRMLVSAGDERGSGGGAGPVVIRRWDMAARRELPAPAPMVHSARVLAFHLDGRTFLSGGRDGTVRHWDAATGRLLQSFALSGDVTALGFVEPVGAIRAISLDPATVTAMSWDATGGQRERVSWAVPRPFHAAFHPDGRTVVVSQFDGSVRRWDATTGQPVADAFHHPGAAILSCTADGRAMAVVTAGRLPTRNPGPVTLRTVVSGALIGSAGPDEVHTAVAVTPDGGRVLAAAGLTVRLWGLPAPAELATDLASAPAVQRLTFSDATYDRAARISLAAGSNAFVTRLGRVADDKPVRDFDLSPAVGKIDPPREDYKPSQAAISPDGTTVASAVDGFGVSLWDAATGRPLAPPTRVPNTIGVIAFSPDGRTLAVGDYSWNVHLLDAKTGMALGPPLRQTDIVASLAFSPDGQTLAVGTHRDWNRQFGAVLWDVAARRQIGMVPTDGPPRLTFSPDGRTLFVASAGAVRSRDVASGRPGDPLSHPRGPTSAAVSPDSRTLLTGGSDGTARLWDADTSRPRPGAAMPHPTGAVTHLAFSPDGRLAAIGYDDHTARLWDLETCRPLGPPVAGRFAVIGLAFLPDGSGWVLTTADGHTRTLPTPAPTSADMDMIARELEARTGLRLDDGPALVTLDKATWRAARAGLTPADYVLAPATESAETRFRAAENDGDAFVARSYLNRMLAAHPDDWRLLARAARMSGSDGQWSAAATGFAQAAAVAPAGGLAVWYRLTAIEAQAENRPEAALWYLDRVVEARPDDWAAHARRASVLGQLGRPTDRAAAIAEADRHGASTPTLVRWARAASAAGNWPAALDLYSAATHRQALSVFEQAEYAVACARTGDAARYRSICDGLARRVDTDPAPARVSAVGWVCVLAPDGLADYSRLLDRVDRTTADVPSGERNRRASLTALRGCLFYRAGQYAAALDALNASGDQDVDTLLFFALTCHRLNQAAEARAYMARAEAIIASGVGQSEQMRQQIAVLRDEADRALRPPPVAEGSGIRK
jgi:WD40 repeat protein/tetratricopeptide (TPR) repeat protein